MEKCIDKEDSACYNNQARGGIAQLARAIGSYPIGRGFKSNFRYQHKADADNVESVL